MGFNDRIKILYYFNETDEPMQKWQRIHIIDELSHHNCDIIVFNSLKFSCKEVANDELLSSIEKNSPDLFMTPYNESEVFVDTICRIKSKGIPTLLICFDNLVVPFVHLNVAKYYDLVWLTSAETKEMFDAVGANTIFLPYAANPYLKGSNEQILAVGFVGSPYGSRVNIINTITSNGIDIYCHCKKAINNFSTQKNIYKNNINIKLVYNFLKFKHGRKILLGAIKNKFFNKTRLYNNSYIHYENLVQPEDLYSTYSKYAISLSFTAARNTGVLKRPLDIVNLRNFEIPMSGGLQFCRFSSEIASYFETDKEIILYHDDAEMVEKAKYYLSEKRFDVRNKIRGFARTRAERCHTWWNRFVIVFDKLGIKYN